MRYASEELINEHEGILFGLRILEKMVGLLKDGTAVDTGDLNGALEFFRLFADTCHHGKEEGLLFPAMEAHGIPGERGPIGQMLSEHTEGRGYIARMAGAVEASPFGRKDFIEAAGGYIRLLRSHIEKENSILFPMGDRRIPAELQEELLRSFEAHEEAVMGPGTHERLHGLLDSLGAKYLSQE